MFKWLLPLLFVASGALAQNVSGGSGGSYCPTIVIGNYANNCASTAFVANTITAVTGDVTFAGTSSIVSTIAANAVTNAKAAQMPANTLKGNNINSTANALDLTPTQVAAMFSPSFTITPTSGVVTLGDANAVAHGSLFGSNAGYTSSNTLRANQNIATVDAESPIGGYGIIGSSRSSDWPYAGAMQNIGVGSFIFNDNTTYVQSGYGIYGESWRFAGAGDTIGMELDTVNRGSSVSISPNIFSTNVGITPTFWSACGGGYPSTQFMSYNCTAALAILTNPGSGTTTQYNTGIVIEAGALATRFGKLYAIHMPTNSAIVWQGSVGDVANINSTATTGSMDQIFINGAVVWQDDATETTRASLTTAGLFSATSFAANGSNGVSCSGTPSASFAVVNGIVTHC